MKKTQWYVQQDNEADYEKFKAKLEILGISVSAFHNAMLPTFLKSLETFNEKFRTITIEEKQLIQL